MRAASTLLCMPPRPRRDDAPNTTGSAVSPSVDELGARRPGAAGVHAVDLGEEDEQPRAHEDRDLRRERVVVAEGDLVGRRRVVLVHDRDGAARRRAPGARDERSRTRRGRRCRCRSGAPAPRAAPRARSARSQARWSFPCPSADAAWSFGTERGRRSRPSCGRPSAIAPDETTATGSPPRTIASDLARARDRAPLRRTDPRGPATRLVPSLTTTVTGAACRRRPRGTGAARGRDTSPGRAARAPSRR